MAIVTIMSKMKQTSFMVNNDLGAQPKADGPFQTILIDVFFFGKEDNASNGFEIYASDYG